MKAVIVTYTEEHFLFLWKHFREVSVKTFYKTYGIKAILEDKDPCCVEIRNTNNELIACAISTGCNLLLGAVQKEYRGNNYQRLLIQACVKFIKSKNYDYIQAYVRTINTSSFINLYKTGFRVIDTIRFYNDDEGFKMQKQLK